MASKLYEFTESIIVGLVLIFVLLPVRILTVQLVDDNWFGSFGIITAIIITLLYLSKNNRLGIFGRMFWRQTIKLHKGKRRIIVYSLLTVAVYFWGSLIFGINFAIDNDEVQTLKIKAISELTEMDKDKITQLEKAIQEKNVLKVQQRMMNEYGKMSWEIIIMLVPYLLVLPIIDPVVWSVITSTANEFSNGYFLHFGTVFFIEALEGIGIIIYTKIITSKATKKTDMV